MASRQGKEEEEEEEEGEEEEEEEVEKEIEADKVDVKEGRRGGGGGGGGVKERGQEREIGVVKNEQVERRGVDREGWRVRPQGERVGEKWMLESRSDTSHNALDESFRLQPNVPYNSMYEGYTHISNTTNVSTQTYQHSNTNSLFLPAEHLPLPSQYIYTESVASSSNYCRKQEKFDPQVVARQFTIECSGCKQTVTTSAGTGSNCYNVELKANMSVDSVGVLKERLSQPTREGGERGRREEGRKEGGREGEEKGREGERGKRGGGGWRVRWTPSQGGGEEREEVEERVGLEGKLDLGVNEECSGLHAAELLNSTSSMDDVRSSVEDKSYLSTEQ